MNSLMNSVAVVDYVASLKAIEKDDVICDCWKCKKPMTAKECDEIPEDKFDAGFPECKGCNGKIPLYNKDGTDVKCWWCNGRFPDTKNVNGVYIHADCENTECCRNCERQLNIDTPIILCENADGEEMTLCTDCWCCHEKEWREEGWTCDLDE